MSVTSVVMAEEIMICCVKSCSESPLIVFILKHHDLHEKATGG